MLLGTNLMNSRSVVEVTLAFRTKRTGKALTFRLAPAVQEQNQVLRKYGFERCDLRQPGAPLWQSQPKSAVSVFCAISNRHKPGERSTLPTIRFRWGACSSFFGLQTKKGVNSTGSFYLTLSRSFSNLTDL